MHARRRHPLFFSGRKTGQQASRRRPKPLPEQGPLVASIRKKIHRLLHSLREQEHPDHREEENMNHHQKLGPILICVVILIAIATFLIAGCMGPAPDQQGQKTMIDNEKGGQPAAAESMTKATPVPSPATTGRSASSPAPSATTIAFDPVSNKKTGARFTVSGTTGLPEGTGLFWQVMPDTGRPPAGVDMNAQIGIMANNRATKGTGTLNRVSLDVDTKDFAPGKYVVIVVSLPGDSGTADPTTGTLAGSTYFTLV